MCSCGVGAAGETWTANGVLAVEKLLLQELWVANFLFSVVTANYYVKSWLVFA